jgi:hypothetical protein
MPQETKHEPMAHARPSSIVSLLSGWVQQGMESFFATQRILVDVAMRQNASAVKTIRESISDPEHSPVALLTELAVEGTANYIDAQRILLDLVQQENELLMEGVKERVTGSNPAAAMVNLVRRSVDGFVEMQQEFLTMASKQSQTVLHNVHAGKPFDRDHLVEVAREGMETFVNAQKKFLDVIAEETTLATSDKHEKSGKPGKKTDIAALARDSANALVNAQKKLLDVASAQMKTNLKLANRSADMVAPFRLPLAKLTGEGVKTFVDAEKAMIDSMMKRNYKHATPDRKKPRKAARRPRRAAASAAASD